MVVTLSIVKKVIIGAAFVASMAGMYALFAVTPHL